MFRFFLLCLLLPVALVAQDFEQVAPKPVPNPRDAQNGISTSPLPEIDPDPTPLFETLKGVVVWDRAEDVEIDGIVVAGIRVPENPLFAGPEFADLLQSRLGLPMTMGGLQELVRDIVVHCRGNDRPVVDVIVPEHDVTEGTLQLVVLEGRIGEVKVEGARWFSPKRIGSTVRLDRGDTISSEELLLDLRWLNQNPFRSIDAVFAPGDEAGYTDLILRTVDRFPLRIYTGYEDSGAELTGEERVLAGFNWGNAFGLEHQLNYQFVSSDDLFTGDSENLRAHAWSYLAPLPWRHNLTFFGSYSNSEVALDPFDLRGGGTQVGTRYLVPLPDLGRHYTHEIEVGFDWKQSANSLEFGFIPASAAVTDIGQWILGYGSRLEDSLGASSLRLEGIFSPGEWFDRQNELAYAAVRPGAESEYGVFRLELARLTRLPGDFTLSNEFVAQSATTNLLPSEQMGLGGYATIRGYDEYSLFNSDEGWSLRNEVRTPSLPLLATLGVEAVPDQLQFLGFFDSGSARAYDGLVSLEDGRNVSTARLSSVGVGLRYSISNWLSLRLDRGFQLTDAGNINEDGRWHVGVMISR